MARGWESKSVEAQTEEALARRSAGRPKRPEPDKHTVELREKKDGILLSRVRVVRELENAHNPRYKALLTKALAGLDAQLSAFSKS